MRNPFVIGASGRERFVWLAVIVVVAFGIGVGAFELADRIRWESRDADAATLVGDSNLGAAWMCDADRPLGWSELTTAASAPDPRSDHSMVYVPMTGRVILFGGGGTGGLLGDTWAYDVVGREWTELPASSSGRAPEARRAHSMVYVALTGEAILFGGMGVQGVLADMWTYDPLRNAWSAAPPLESAAASVAAPAPRRSHAMVFDALAGKMILFGGSTDDAVLGDTWSYDPIWHKWTEMRPGGETPAPRQGHSMVFDPTSGLVIMFGGVGIDGSVEEDIWTYDAVGNRWTQLHPLSPAPGRSDSAAACVTTTGGVARFGGLDARMKTTADTWSYNSHSSWTRVFIGEISPSARSGSSVTYCDLTDTCLLFGGRDDVGHPLDDTWVYWAPAKWW